MKWLFIIDPIDKLKKDTDTTYAIIKESSKTINTYIATIQDLYFENCTKVNANKIKFKNDNYKLGKKQTLELNNFNLIIMRKEPPYDLNFHYATSLLSCTKTTVVNSPQSLRDFNEKLIILHFKKIIPKTLVSANTKHILKFIKDHDDIMVIKALDSYQGKVVKRVHHKDKNIKKTINKFTSNGKSSIMIQEFLKNVIYGDKRILMLGGKFLGVVNRIPKKGSYISNFGAGGTGYKTNLTKKDKIIINTVSKFLKKNNIQLVGLDVIDGYLTEINITCPTGLQHINKLENKTLEKTVVKHFKKLSK